MKVKVLGKAHRAGLSAKTGRPYNINVLHCVGIARNVEGQAVMTITVNGDEYPYDQVQVGREYLAEYDSTGALIDFQPTGNGGAANSSGGR